MNHDEIRLRVPAKPMHRKFGIFLSLLILLAAGGSAWLFRDPMGIFLALPLTLLFSIIWYFSSFRWHWRMVYELTDKELRFIREGVTIRVLPFTEIEKSRLRYGSLTLVGRGFFQKNLWLNPEHSSEQMLALINQKPEPKAVTPS